MHICNNKNVCTTAIAIKDLDPQFQQIGDFVKRVEDH